MTRNKVFAFWLLCVVILLIILFTAVPSS